MGVFSKLQKARYTLSKRKIKKSGRNKHIGYEYFELDDILPHITQIFDEVGLCSVFNMSAEVATLSVFNSEDAEEHPAVFTIPRGKVQLKSAQDIQNIGSEITYSRRYLYFAALDIVEKDGIEHATGEPVDEKLEDFKKSLADKPEIKAHYTCLNHIENTMEKHGKVFPHSSKIKEWGALKLWLIEHAESKIAPALKTMADKFDMTAYQIRDLVKTELKQDVFEIDFEDIGAWSDVDNYLTKKVGK